MHAPMAIRPLTYATNDSQRHVVPFYPNSVEKYVHDILVEECPAQVDLISTEDWRELVAHCKCFHLPEFLATHEDTSKVKLAEEVLPFLTPRGVQMLLSCLKGMCFCY